MNENKNEKKTEKKENRTIWNPFSFPENDPYLKLFNCWGGLNAPHVNSPRGCVDTTSANVISNNATSGQHCWRQESKHFFSSLGVLMVAHLCVCVYVSVYGFMSACVFVCVCALNSILGVKFESVDAKNWTAWSFPSCLRRTPGERRGCWRTAERKTQWSGNLRLWKNTIYPRGVSGHSNAFS